MDSTVSPNPDGDDPLVTISSDSPLGAEEQPLSSNGTPAQLPSRYRITSSLGSGAFGQVLKAHDVELGRDVAIKTLHPKHLKDRRIVEFFRQEGRRAAALDHPHIVPIFDVGVCDDGQLYLVNKYIDGGSLQKRIKQSPIPQEQAVEIIALLAEALHHAHQNGLVHRDVKPDNVLLDAQGRPLLTDFGLALHEDEQRQRRGDISGSPPYMAPEQTYGRSQHLDGRTDIWALGVMLYEMLTGRQPFGGSNLAEVFEEIREREPKPPRQIDDSIPVQLQSIVLKCLAKPVAQRYATAGDLAAELRQWQADEQAAQSDLPAPTPSQPSYRYMLPAGAGVLLAAALLAMTWGFWRGEATPPTPAADSTFDTAAAERRSQPLAGDIDLAVVRGGKLVPIKDPRARPLREGDGVRVEAQLNQPAYLYLIWIDEDGRAQHFYPGAPGDWRQLASSTRPVQSVILPDAAGGYPITEAQSGMQTILLLARRTPLPAGEGMGELFEGLPKQTLQDERALVYLDGGAVSERRNRAPDFFSTVQVEDPLLQTQSILSDRLREHFELVRAVSVALKTED